MWFSPLPLDLWAGQRDGVLTTRLQPRCTGLARLGDRPMLHWAKGGGWWMLQSSGCSLPKQVCTLNPAFLKPLYLWGFVSENMCVCTHLHECKAGGIFVCGGECCSTCFVCYNHRTRTIFVSDYIDWQESFFIAEIEDENDLRNLSMLIMFV